MRPDSRRGFRGDLWRVARLLTRRDQGHEARRGDLRTTILAAPASRCPGASRVNAKRVWISGLGPGRVKTFFILQNYTRPGVIHATRPCVYQKLKLERSGDEVRLGWQVT